VNVTVVKFRRIRLSFDMPVVNWNENVFSDCRDASS